MPSANVSSFISYRLIHVKILDFTSSEVGLVISSAIALIGQFQFGVRQSAEMENQMTSVERVVEYGNLSSEASWESNQGSFSY